MTDRIGRSLPLTRWRLYVACLCGRRVTARRLARCQRSGRMVVCRGCGRLGDEAGWSRLVGRRELEVRGPRARVVFRVRPPVAAPRRDREQDALTPEAPQVAALRRTVN